MEEYKMKETVIEIIAEQLEVDKNEITGETNFMEDLEADSLDIFQVLSEIEDELDITIETDENVQTVDQLIAHIEKAQK
ncbi:MAG TPA: acyl carrier protein [Atopostipes sp.]|jgi:acyl carrier protein|nr:acyl carrier protein [Atopostipes sp.]